MGDLVELGARDHEAAIWNLEPIVDDQGEDGARRLVSEARARAESFATEFGGGIGDLDSDGLVSAVGELTEIRELLWRASGYARMRGYADSSDPVAAALRGAVEAAEAEIDARLLFFELEWVALDDDRAEALLAGAGDQLDFAAHHLRRLRAKRPYLLGDEQERILAETSVQRLSAWKRLYTENAARLMVELDGEPVPMSRAQSLLGTPIRERRLQAMTAIAAGAAAGLPTRVAAYNQVLGEKAVDDRLRGYPTWLSSRNLANETTDAAVDALLAAVAARHDLPRRWNRLKARLLDIARLATSDLRAPLPYVTRSVPFSESQELIVSAWSQFSPRAGEIVERFFAPAQGLIDAPLRANKQAGALCAQAGSTRHPYVLVNYDSRPGDTMALAHELGHAVHLELARSQRALQWITSIPMLEVASTFSEALVGEHLSARAADDRERLALMAARLDDAMLNVFEACTDLSSEAAMHRARREQGELSAEQLSEIWAGSMTELWGDTIEIEDGYRQLWSLIPHTIWAPGYMYSYAYGLLTAWSAFAQYRVLGEGFAEKFLAMLAAGGSRSPAELARMVGLDIADPDYWNAGLELLDGMLREAEAIAEAF
jgi:oligoendopeptidase F